MKQELIFALLIGRSSKLQRLSFKEIIWNRFTMILSVHQSSI